MKYFCSITTLFFLLLVLPIKSCSHLCTKRASFLGHKHVLCSHILYVNKFLSPRDLFNRTKNFLTHYLRNIPKLIPYFNAFLRRYNHDDFFLCSYQDVYLHSPHALSSFMLKSDFLVISNCLNQIIAQFL